MSPGLILDSSPSPLFSKRTIALKCRWKSLKIQLPAADSELLTALCVLKRSQLQNLRSSGCTLRKCCGIIIVLLYHANQISDRPDFKNVGQSANSHRPCGAFCHPDFRGCRVDGVAVAAERADSRQRCCHTTAGRSHIAYLATYLCLYQNTPPNQSAQSRCHPSRHFEPAGC